LLKEDFCDKKRARFFEIMLCKITYNILFCAADNITASQTKQRAARKRRAKRKEDRK
jgi:hypothetical protein